MVDQAHIDHVQTVFRAFLDLTAFYKAKIPLPKNLTIELTEIYFQNKQRDDTVEIIVGMINDYYTKVLKQPVLSSSDVTYCLKILLEEGTRKMASHRDERHSHENN